MQLQIFQREYNQNVQPKSSVEISAIIFQNDIEVLLSPHVKGSKPE